MMFTMTIMILRIIDDHNFSGNLYDGSALAAYGDVVVVTINYRLGVFGRKTSIFLGALFLRFPITTVLGKFKSVLKNPKGP